MDPPNRFSFIDFYFEWRFCFGISILHFDGPGPEFSLLEVVRYDGKWYFDFMWLSYLIRTWGDD